MDFRRSAGVALFIGAVQFVIGMQIAEFLYLDYSASDNYISDLGATCRETCVVHQPSAFIFNSSVSLLGILVIAGSYYLWRELNKPVLPLLFGLAGVGTLGVGLFPETAGTVHEVVSIMAFLFGGLSTVAAYRFVDAPFSYFSVIMGITSLIALVLFGSEIFIGLGPGGMERMIAYPVVLWVIGLGGYLMGSAKK